MLSVCADGRVIGVCTAIFTNTGTSAGVGFAIPISTVRSVVPQLIEFGKVVRPALNVQVGCLMTAAPACRAGQGQKTETGLPAPAPSQCTGNVLAALYLMASGLTGVLEAGPAAGTPCAALVCHEP